MIGLSVCMLCNKAYNILSRRQSDIAHTDLYVDTVDMLIWPRSPWSPWIAHQAGLAVVLQENYARGKSCIIANRVKCPIKKATVENVIPGLYGRTLQRLLLQSIRCWIKARLIPRNLGGEARTSS